jgi:eukaryotic-like serine/threonine-protein kinase
MPLAPGTKLGHYEIIAPLGAGGMGEVYRSRDTVLKREVAVKILPDSYSSDTERLRRFQQEAEAAATLNHPNILTVHQVGRQDNISYIVTELLQGETLREKLRHGPLPVRTAIDYATQIARGLDTAHENGIIHRDLKPENLFITKDGRVKILDFGLVKVSQPQPDALASTQAVVNDTTPGAVMGTVGYMSPEQVRGQLADPRSDIFAFGAVLFEMLTGKRAFHGTTYADTVSAVLHHDPPISELTANQPPGLQRIISRCLQKNREQRFHSAADLAFAIEA